MTNKFHFLLFQSAAENVSVNALIKDETIWPTQKAKAQLFGVQTPAISKHLKNIFNEGELEEKVVVSNMEITTRKYDLIKDRGKISKKSEDIAKKGDIKT
ncbi:MAG: hypothetical protein U9N62_08550 [Thermotogota bacterium]|nr:hypothetical protein [Thermotogota bacterium]